MYPSGDFGFPSLPTLPSLPATNAFSAPSTPAAGAVTGATMLTMNNFSPSAGPFGYVNQSQVIRLRPRDGLPDPLSPQMVSKIKQVRTWAKAVKQFPEGEARNKEMNRILDYCISSEPHIIPQLKLCINGIWARDQLQPADTRELVSGLCRMDADQWPKALRRSGWDKRLQNPETLSKLISELVAEFPKAEVQLRYLRDLMRALRPNEAMVRSMIEATRNLPEFERAQLCCALVEACGGMNSQSIESILIDVICRRSGILKDPAWGSALILLMKFKAMSTLEAQVAMLNAMMALDKTSTLILLENFKPVLAGCLKQASAELENEYACQLASRVFAMASALSIQNNNQRLASVILNGVQQLSGRLDRPWGGQMLQLVMTNLLSYLSGDAAKLMDALPQMIKLLASLDPVQKFGVLSSLADYLEGVNPKGLPASQWDTLFDLLQEICLEYKGTELATSLMSRLATSWQRLPSADADTRCAQYLSLVGEICPMADQSALINRFTEQFMGDSGVKF